MNTYFSYLGRLIEERTPIQQEGYYILHEDYQAGYSKQKPVNVEIVTQEIFLNALVEGCKEVIRAFSNRPDNKGVYAFCLYADEQGSIYIYMNTLECFEDTLKKYQAGNPRYYEMNNINSLKYSKGDFQLQFWQEHMGVHGQYVEKFERLLDLIWDLDRNDSVIVDGEPIIAFEAGIMKSGFQVLALKAVLQLVSDHAFDSLNKTDNFIAYASTGDDYIDYSIVMRKTIDQELFYRIFPEDKEKDQQFEALMKQHQHQAVGEFIAFWSDTIQSDARLTLPFTYYKSEIEVFKQLERYGNALAEECIERLIEILGSDSLERQEFNRIYFYVEALYFAGKLTEVQAEKCRLIAKRMIEKTADLKDTSAELSALINQQ